MSSRTLLGCCAAMIASCADRARDSEYYMCKAVADSTLRAWLGQVLFTTDPGLATRGGHRVRRVRPSGSGRGAENAQGAFPQKFRHRHSAAGGFLAQSVQVIGGEAHGDLCGELAGLGLWSAHGHSSGTSFCCAGVRVSLV